MLVGLRPEDFMVASGNGAEGGSLDAQLEITEQLGPEVLAHFRVDGLAALRTAAPLPDAGEEQPPAGLGFGHGLVARFDPNFAGRPGDRLRLVINRDRMRLFDPQSGEAIA